MLEWSLDFNFTGEKRKCFILSWAGQAKPRASPPTVLLQTLLFLMGGRNRLAILAARASVGIRKILTLQSPVINIVSRELSTHNWRNGKKVIFSPTSLL